MVWIDWATHVLQRQKQRVVKKKFLTNLKKLPKFGLYAVTRMHEVEIVSNRRSLCYGEYYSNFAHTAHHARKMEKVGKLVTCFSKITILLLVVIVYDFFGDSSEVDTR